MGKGLFRGNWKRRTRADADSDSDADADTDTDADSDTEMTTHNEEYGKGRHICLRREHWRYQTDVKSVKYHGRGG